MNNETKIALEFLTTKGGYYHLVFSYVNELAGNCEASGKRFTKRGLYNKVVAMLAKEEGVKVATRGRVGFIGRLFGRRPESVDLNSSKIDKKLIESVLFGLNV